MTDQTQPHPCACSSGRHADPELDDMIVVPADAVLAVLAAWPGLSPRGRGEAVELRMAAADDGYDRLCELLGVSS